MRRFTKKRVIFIAAFAFLFALIVAAYLYLNLDSSLKLQTRELDIQEQSVKNTAIQECFSAATNTTKDGGTERTEPIFYIYILCLKDKGYETNFK